VTSTRVRPTTSRHNTPPSSRCSARTARWSTRPRSQGSTPGPRPGTFQSCSLRNRLDYILLSEELAGTVTGGGIFRKGLWGDPGNVNPPQAWEIYPEITASVHAASDHAAIWVDLDL
jgi:endonuclease/exonuclease/phosphatase family metal-dependent hydrolase